MTQVLNAQSDSVLVVHKNESSEDKIDVKFCNKSSIDLFGIDTKEASKEELANFGLKFK